MWSYTSTASECRNKDLKKMGLGLLVKETDVQFDDCVS